MFQYKMLKCYNLDTYALIVMYVVQLVDYTHILVRRLHSHILVDYTEKL